MKTWKTYMEIGGIDSYNNYSGSLDHENDFVLLSRTRDSILLDNLNFDVALELIKKVDSDNVYVLSFNHWACGWIEYIFIKPNTKTFIEAEKIEEALSNYPILDDTEYYQRLFARAELFWNDMTINERVDICRNSNQSIFLARSCSIPDNDYIRDYCECDI